MTEGPRHRNCRSYAPIDAVHGLCRMTGVEVPAEGAPCLYFMRRSGCPAGAGAPSPLAGPDGMQPPTA